MSDQKPANGDTPSDAQKIVDKHLKAMMDDLRAAGSHALGTVVGVLCSGETLMSWCIEEDVRDAEGKAVPTEVIVKRIVESIEELSEEEIHRGM